MPEQHGAWQTPSSMNDNFASVLHGLDGLGAALNKLPNYHPQGQQQPAAPKKNEQNPTVAPKTQAKQPIPQQKIQQKQGPAKAQSVKQAWSDAQKLPDTPPAVGQIGRQFANDLMYVQNTIDQSVFSEPQNGYFQQNPLSIEYPPMAEAFPFEYAMETPGMVMNDIGQSKLGAFGEPSNDWFHTQVAQSLKAGTERQGHVAYHDYKDKVDAHE